ncbi:MAG: formylmethanofuran dehydrogenase subunit B [Planctomycetaceae bacterium]
MLQTFENVACTVCGCVCDDLRLTVDGERVVQAERACSLAEPWFLTQCAAQAPLAEMNGQPVKIDEAVDAAARVLASADAPLIYGLSRSSTAGQRAACALADRLGAVIDTTASLGHAPSVMALQEAGESTCSLGEVRNRSDLVIFWGSDPVESHPRHLERYSADPVGEFLPGGRADRTLVVVDVRPTATSALADLSVQVAPGRDFEVLWTLRGLLRGIRPAPRYDAGAPLSTLEDLARRMQSCRYGAAFFGLGLARQGHHVVEALLRLVTDLNRHTRFIARRMRVSGDVAGADSVLCWQTGYPFSVSLARGYPRYSPGEFTAQPLLERDEVDACLLLGGKGLERFSDRALARLQKLPTIVLDAPAAPCRIRPGVRFATAVYGIHERGTAYRMDETPIPLMAVLRSPHPSEATVLTQIINRLAAR